MPSNREGSSASAAATPSAPALLTPGTIPPPPGEFLSTTTPTFKWSEVEGAEGYGLYISRKGSSGVYALIFSSERSEGGLTGASLTLPAGILSDGNEYRWNMRARHGAEWGPFSARLYFNTGVSAAPHASPEIVSPGTIPPQPAETLSNATPTFQWNEVEGAEAYGLYISRKDSSGAYNLIFNSDRSGKSITGSSLPLPAGILTGGNEYRWNMRARNGAGWGPFSVRRYFNTAFPEPTPARPVQEAPTIPPPPARPSSPEPLTPRPTQPPAGQPSTPQPPVAQPSSTQPPGVQPSAAPPPAAPPPAAQPAPAGATMPRVPEAATAPAMATLEASRGEVTVIRLGRPQEAAPSMSLARDDVVVTKRGRATVRFNADGTVLRLGPDTRIQIAETATERDVTLFLGRLWAHVVRLKERSMRFSTGSTIAAIRGTELSFGVAVDGDETQISVLEGEVQTKTDAGSLNLQAGQTSVSGKGRTPALSRKVRPQDAVQWALYYLPVLYVKPGELGDGQEWQPKARESTEAARRGDLPSALGLLEGIEAGGVRDPRFFTYRASLLLATGSVDEAGEDLKRALSLEPAESGALALQTIIAVAKNQLDLAIRTARGAVAANPDSATAHVALSYALQAKFDLESARESLEAAVRLDPGDPLAWARLAEMHSSLGDRRAAFDAAQKAVDLDPSLARTQTVLGFSYLTRVQTRKAREAFKKAIEIDPDDPLPRLGLGLTLIREGDLEEGNRELEIAVSLDPGQSLIRSYLGKGYFEAKRAGLEERELNLAKQLDPLDPTPRLYDAIAKQTANRPVEALQSLDEAIELNDNRAVYRSRLLLDSDQAARSASLGRVYSDLGFQNLAMVEGWNSVNTDPTNFSAHRLLADSYAAQPRHEIARVSELFQSQMLQPLNTTPIQPSLGESSLFLISSQGPAALSFNEFNPLFNRDQINFQGSLLAGGDDTLAGEGIVAGIYKRFSFSAGYSGYSTDGFRENSFQDDKIGNLFTQFELGSTTSAQVEARYRKRENGDLDLRFLEDDFNPFQRQTTEGANVRVGLRQEIGPAVTLLASYVYADTDTDFTLPNPLAGETFTLARDERADSAEGQILFRSPIWKIVAGGGYFNIDSDETTRFTLVDPLAGPLFTDITTGDRTIRHTNVYAYSHLTLPTRLTLTLGASGDYFEETGDFLDDLRIPGVPPAPPVPIDPPPVLGEKNQINPKAGFTWSLKSGTTLRGAWFRTLKRTLITDQTLEPTQVAGFNQFYDDPSATESEVWGAAIDQKFGSRVFAGAEFGGRKLTIPQLLLKNGVNLTLEELDGDERLARSYLFVAPHPRLTFGAEYEYEKLNRDSDLFFSFTNVKTHRVPLSVRLFFPVGLSAMLGATYLQQTGTFVQPGLPAVEGDRDFWVVDAALRYRLPRRYGFIVAGVNNLTDQRSTFEATDSRNLSMRPGRVFFGRVVLAFP